VADTWISLDGRAARRVVVTGLTAACRARNRLDTGSVIAGVWVSTFAAIARIIVTIRVPLIARCDPTRAIVAGRHGHIRQRRTVVSARTAVVNVALRIGAHVPADGIGAVGDAGARAAMRVAAASMPAGAAVLVACLQVGTCAAATGRAAGTTDDRSRLAAQVAGKV
jgi:hypothetical protein